MEVDEPSTNKPEDSQQSQVEMSEQEMNTSTLDTAKPTSDEKTEESTKDGSNNKETTVQSGDKDVSGKSGANVDVFAYTKDGQFTSEIFKIEIFNLPDYVGFGQLKKRLLSIDLKPNKVKMIGQRGCAFITFRCEEDREDALNKCNGHVWKGKTWSAKKALPAADPLAQKRKKEAEADSAPQAKHSREEDSDLPLAERLNLAVTPLYKQPYQEQLKSKEEELKSYLRRLGREIEKNNNGIRHFLGKQRKDNSGLCCPMEPIKSSPELYGYRNKCEFTIGRSPTGQDKVVGFRFGRYSKGVTTVLEVDECIHVPEAMKKVTKLTQKYIQDCSVYPGFAPEDKAGNWRQATVRTNLRGDIMLVLVFHPHKLNEDKVSEEREKVKEFFEKGEGSRCGITSMYFSVRSDRVSDATKEEHLFGEEYIIEDLLDLKFRISPTAFFQVNTMGAEVLYSTVADWCCVSDKTVLLDVCCGTGTIGLTMAKIAEKVVGVELCAEAVQDAQYNAKLNELSNTQFVCSKAEDFLPNYVRSLYGAPVVAVVDPPRAGLHPEVVRAIRRCQAIKRVVFVSCNPKGAIQNIVDLTRAESKRIKGNYFRLVRSVAVDMFPHSPHCEFVMLFDRYDPTAATPRPTSTEGAASETELPKISTEGLSGPADISSKPQVNSEGETAEVSSTPFEPTARVKSEGETAEVSSTPFKPTAKVKSEGETAEVSSTPYEPTAKVKSEGETAEVSSTPSEPTAKVKSEEGKTADVSSTSSDQVIKVEK